jgi:hypothetical protein
VGTIASVKAAPKPKNRRLAHPLLDQPAQRYFLIDHHSGRT